MSANEIIRAMIREELMKAIKQQLNESAQQLDERNKVKRGQIWSKKKERGVYTSAGTLPSSQPDKAGRPAKSNVDPKKRDAVGKKYINLYARGDVSGTNKSKDARAIKFRQQVDDYAADEYGANPSAKEKMSAIWALASVRSRMSSNLSADKDGKLGRVTKPGSRERKDAAAKAKAEKLAAKANSKKSKKKPNK